MQRSILNTGDSNIMAELKKMFLLKRLKGEMMLTRRYQNLRDVE